MSDNPLIDNAVNRLAEHYDSITDIYRSCFKSHASVTDRGVVYCVGEDFVIQPYRDSDYGFQLLRCRERYPIQWPVPLSTDRRKEVKSFLESKDMDPKTLMEIDIIDWHRDMFIRHIESYADFLKRTWE